MEDRKHSAVVEFGTLATIDAREHSWAQPGRNLGEKPLGVDPGFEEAERWMVWGVACQGVAQLWLNKAQISCG